MTTGVNNRTSFLIFVLSILFLPLPLLAAVESFVVSGTIYDSNRVEIPFASIGVAGSAEGTVSDGEGKYRLTIESGKCVICVSAAGYSEERKSLIVKKDTIVDFVLNDDAITLSSVNVYGKSAGRRLAEGAFTVNALEINSKVNNLVTITDIVNKSPGILVRRQGGAGSDYDLSINGLSGSSIRYFIDGVPLDSRGSEINLDHIPVSSVERVELYKGVVPSYLSADALGGAINIVTKHRRQNYLDASYGAGSFHTHTGDISGQFFIPGTAIAVRPAFSLNYSKNDYMMKNVEVWDDNVEKYIMTEKRRFHDGYRSLYGEIEAGVNDVAWADNFFLTGSYSDIDKEIQTGAMQNKVYGEARRKAHAWNIGARYSKRWGKLDTRINLSHTWDYSETIDSAFRKYSWDGTWQPSSGNEMRNGAKTMRIYRRPITVLNAGVGYKISGHHDIALNYMLNRRGNGRHDELDKTFEPTNDVVTKHILSLTYSQSFFNDNLNTTYFVKDYINSTAITQTDNATITGSDKIDPKSTKSYWGAGFGGRYIFTTAVAVKGSYEHSVRLPLSNELLGNGTTIYPNLALSPETSNNYNLGLFGDWFIDDDNTVNYEVGGFIRHVQNYIRATVSERDGMMQYVNEPAIDVKGVDFELKYFWKDAFQLSFNGSCSDARDLKKYKTDGNPSATYKNKVPNRPWLFGNIMASYAFNNLFCKSDRLKLEASFDWTHWYYLNWEAYGSKESKAVIPTQKITNVSLSYSWVDNRYNVSLECDNVFNRLAYDNYMLQKPGRAIYIKFRLFIK